MAVAVAAAAGCRAFRSPALGHADVGQPGVVMTPYEIEYLTIRSRSGG